MSRRLGWLPDPPKAHREKPDLTADELLAGTSNLPVSASVRHLILDVLDQGGIGSCVSNAIMQAVRCSHVRQGVTDAKLGSRLFGYYFSRAYHHQTSEDSGTFLRTYFQAMTKFGFCPERFWPYSDQDGKYKKMPDGTAFRAAFDQANPTVYRRISATGGDRLNQIKRALVSGYAVTFGTDVDSDFCSGKLVEPLKPPTVNIAGGHAMMISGYQDRGNVFEVCNSWGADFGDKGFCWFSDEYVAWSGTRDLWIVEKAPKYSE